MIYLLEDDESIRKLVSYVLKNSGFEIETFALPSQFWRAVEERIPRLVLLDIMLPEESGLDVLRKLRTHPGTSRVPVMMLTAKSEEIDKVIGLDSGADDYIGKPFGMMELVSRIKALLRRTEQWDGDTVLEEGLLYVSPSRHVVKVNGEKVALTLKEFKLLCCLMEKKGQVFSRDELLSDIWGYAYRGESRTVDVHIRTLRQKLGEAGHYIETVKGAGYKFGGEE